MKDKIIHIKQRYKCHLMPLLTLQAMPYGMYFHKDSMFISYRNSDLVTRHVFSGAKLEHSEICLKEGTITSNFITNMIWHDEYIYILDVFNQRIISLQASTFTYCDVWSTREYGYPSEGIIVDGNLYFNICNPPGQFKGISCLELNTHHIINNVFMFDLPSGGRYRYIKKIQKQYLVNQMASPDKYLYVVDFDQKRILAQYCFDIDSSMFIHDYCWGEGYFYLLLRTTSFNMYIAKCDSQGSLIYLYALSEVGEILRMEYYANMVWLLDIQKNMVWAIAV